MMTARDPQLALRLDAAPPDPALRWHDGAALAFLGRTLTLRLDSAAREAALEGEQLHLPLPPQATPRQIRDRAEAWLRDAAYSRLSEILVRKSTAAGRRPPGLALSFAARGHWAEPREDGSLRCNWRLIEQPLPVIEQVLGRAVTALPAEHAEDDLFAAPA